MSENAIIQQEQNVGIQMPTQAAMNVWQNKDAFDQVARVANMLSKSTIVPQNYQGKPEDCFIAVEMAARMNTSPIFIMQNLFVVKGKPSWAGQACMAMIMSCGKFKNVKHVYTGERGKDNRGCYVEATRISDGEILRGTEITIQMAKDEGWMSNSKWRNMPEQMLGYRAASFFARMFCPEAMMGLQTTEEIYDAHPVTLVPSAQNLSNTILEEEAAAPEPEKKTTRKKAEKPAEPISTDVVPLFICEECGKEIAGAKKFTAEQIATASKEKYGKQLCVDCGKKAKAKAEQEAYQQALAEQSNVEPENDLAAQLMVEAEG